MASRQHIDSGTQSGPRRTAVNRRAASGAWLFDEKHDFETFTYHGPHIYIYTNEYPTKIPHFSKNPLRQRTPKSRSNPNNKIRLTMNLYTYILIKNQLKAKNKEYICT
jgi:hypothetical protein